MENSQTAQKELPKDTKPARFRSVAYPSNSITHCVGLVSSIYKIFGNVFATRSSISKQLEISDSHLQSQLSSCVQYGLLELKSNEGYKSTPLFTKIYKPLPNEKPEDGYLEAFKNPELYRNVFKEVNNETLTANGLSIILFRNHKVSDNASVPAAKIFIENAKFLDLINDENLFSLESVPVDNNKDQEAEEEPEAINESNNRDNGQKPPLKHTEVIYLPPADNQNNGGGFEQSKKFNTPPIPVFVDDEGNVAEVYLPKGFNKAHIEKIIKVLQAQIA